VSKEAPLIKPEKNRNARGFRGYLRVYLK